MEGSIVVFQELPYISTRFARVVVKWEGGGGDGEGIVPLKKSGRKEMRLSEDA